MPDLWVIGHSSNISFCLQFSKSTGDEDEGEDSSQMPVFLADASFAGDLPCRSALLLRSIHFSLISFQLSLLARIVYCSGYSQNI